MNSTALRANTQLCSVVPSTNNTHMVFADEQHEKFYYEKLEQIRYQDCYQVHRGDHCQNEGEETC